MNKRQKNDLQGGKKRLRKKWRVILAEEGTSLSPCWEALGMGGEGGWGQMVGVWKAKQRGLNLSWLHSSEAGPHWGAMGMGHLDPSLWINWWAESRSLGELMAEGELTQLVRTKSLPPFWHWKHSALTWWPGDVEASHFLLLNLKLLIWNLLKVCH